MKAKISGIVLFGLTAASVLFYPQLKAKTHHNPIQVKQHLVANEAPKVDVVFVLDTTGSMDGLIQAAKEKIWSMATTMASAQPTPEIRIGLVAYRDRGDEYVTRIVDLSADLDSVYATLMDFEANGGGDTPESVNKALYDAVHNMSWSQGKQVYQAVFLVGDAPPHMDYDEVRYPQIAASAKQKGIVINTIQCGEMPITSEPWMQIASLGHGRFFQVGQAGSAVAYSSPYDSEIADLSAKLDDTRLYFGTHDEKKRMQQKVAATDKLNKGSSIESLARRGTFNASSGGRTNLLGDNELVDAVASGAVNLKELEADVLPETLQSMAPARQELVVAELAEKRAQLKRKIQVLSQDRDDYLTKKVEAAGGLKDSLDQQLYEAVRLQAGKAGLAYEDGPDY